MNVKPVSLKTSNDVKTRCYKNQNNTLGLMPGPEGTCPHCTTGKGGCWSVMSHRTLPTCYMSRLLAVRLNVKAPLQHNTDILKQATKEEQVRLLSAMVSAFEKKEMKREKPQLFFRLHFSGDVYDAQYTEALKETMLAFPKVNFWIFTRSFPFVHILEGIKNLSIYVSLDVVNFDKGIETYKKNPFVKIAYLSSTDDFQDELKKRGIQDMEGVCLKACPVDSKKIPLAESCVKCRMCISNKKVNHIWFKTK